MTPANPHRLVLDPHPSTRSDAIHTLEIEVSASRNGIVTCNYSLQADMARIRIPAEDPRALSDETAGRADGLWKHTCFEAFIQPAESPEYLELNFSPARQWAVYRFDGYRTGMSVVPLPDAPRICVSRSQQGLELSAVVRLPNGPAPGYTRRAKLAVAAVVEDESGRLSYWAGRHAPGKPDFHHPAGFAFELHHEAP